MVKKKKQLKVQENLDNDEALDSIPETHQTHDSEIEVSMNDELDPLDSILETYQTHGSDIERDIERPFKSEEEIDEHIDKEIAKSNAEKQRKIQEMAYQILKSGEAVDYILETFQTVHVGDEDVAKVLLLSIASQSVKDCNGIQPSISGDYGKGKTHCCRTMHNLIPEEYRWETTLSDKALYYSENLKPGIVIFSDDADLSKDLESTIKRATSNFQNNTKYTTFIKGKSEKLSIPRRIVWWLTSVDEKYSDELLDRQFRISVDESPEQDNKVTESKKEKVRTGIGVNLPNKRSAICREIIRNIKSHKLFNVVIPYSNRIKFSDESNRRNNDLFFDMISAFAVLNYEVRETDEKDILKANIEDFKCAKELYIKYIATEKIWFDSSEKKILEVLSENGEINVKTIAEKTGFTEDWVRKKMKKLCAGKKNGLVDKVPELNCYDRTKPYTYSLHNFDIDKPKKVVWLMENK